MNKLFRRIQSYAIYRSNLKEYRRQEVSAKVKLKFGKPYPCLRDRYQTSGSARGHYFHQDLLVARRVFANAPESHVDVGSRIDGFVAHVASYREIRVLDIRAQDNLIPNVRFEQCDITGVVPGHLLESADSVSCLHALEHFGLGRYGDEVAYDGYLAGLENLYRILKSGGRMYLSTPIGPQRVEFDAHRVFSVGYLLSLLEPRFDVAQFSYVDDAGDLHEGVTLEDDLVATNFGCRYGCGIFELVKRK